MRQGTVAALVIAAATALVVMWPLSERLTGERTLMFTVWGAPFEDVLYEGRYAQEWERLNEGIEVDYRRFGEELPSKYNAWHVRGRGPEVMRIRVTDYHRLAARGMLLPLDDLLAPPPTPEEAAAELAAAAKRYPKRLAPPALRVRPGYRKRDGDDANRFVDPALKRFQELSEAIDDVPPHLRRLLTIDGMYGERVYAIPADHSPYGLLYNRELFLRHNAEHPNDQVNFPPADGSWTWEDFRTAARKLTRREGAGAESRVTQAGVDFAVGAWPFMTFFVQAGGELWSADQLTCTVDSAAGVETLNYFRQLQRVDGSFNPSLATYETGTAAERLFAAGQTAMLLDGPWRVPSLERQAATLDFAVAPLPIGKVPAVVSGCVMWAISANARYPDDAWDFVRWLAAPEQAITYWEVLRSAPPASIAALASARFQQTPGLRNGADTLWLVPPMSRERFESRASWMRHAVEPSRLTGRPPGFVPAHPNQTELEDELKRMMREWLHPSNEEAAEVVLERAVDRVHRLIDRDRAAHGLPAVSRPLR